MKNYPAIYRTQGIDYPIIIHNNEKILSFWLGNHYFYGTELSAMRTDDELTIDLPRHHGDLCDCQFLYCVPQQLTDKQQQIYQIELNIEHRLGKPAKNGGLDEETIIIQCDFNHQSFMAQGGWYEDVLLDLQRQLGQDFYFYNCFGCLYSDYSIFGQSAFASLMCFYSQKDDYFKAQNKSDDITLYKNAEKVQETACCGDFLPRIQAVGYRG